VSPLTVRQEEIIRAAMTIIEDRGAQSLSFRKIADAIGISEPAIYRHFVNKDDLLVKIVVYSITRLVSIISERSGETGETMTIIERIFEDWIDTLTREIPVTRIFYLPGMFINDERVVEEIVRTKVDVEKRFSTLIDRGRRDGSIRKDVSDETLKLLLGGPLQFLVHEWVLTGKNYDLRTRWSAAWKELKEILGPRVEETTAADSEGSRT
jgi:AcrR family transcriptional regulator